MSGCKHTNLLKLHYFSSNEDENKVEKYIKEQQGSTKSVAKGQEKSEVRHNSLHADLDLNNNFF